MKIRIKFSKYGSTKFIGHLDMQRYFQKLIRRSAIDIAYSQGYNPHQIMSFAQPLGVGTTSCGEYLDIEVNSYSDRENVLSSLNENSVDEIIIYDFKEIPDNSKPAMTSVAAGSYYIYLEDKDCLELIESYISIFDEFSDIFNKYNLRYLEEKHDRLKVNNLSDKSFLTSLGLEFSEKKLDKKSEIIKNIINYNLAVLVLKYHNKDKIEITKTNKKGIEKIVDIKPFIYEFNVIESSNFGFTITTSHGSVANINPNKVIDTFIDISSTLEIDKIKNSKLSSDLKRLHIEMLEPTLDILKSLKYHRIDLLTNDLIPLGSV